jgi:S-adenosylmethionine hydrolase
VIQEARDWGGELEFFHLNREEYWLDNVSSVFHGRDIFAPVGAHLVNGVPLNQLGSPVDDPVMLKIPVPRRTGNGWEGEVIHIDSFGNLATNLTSEHFNTDRSAVKVEIGGQIIKGLVKAFGERAPGELAALFDSSGYLSISVVNGDAARHLGAHAGTPVHVVMYIRPTPNR